LHRAPRQGPLSGLRVIELAGLGPGAFAGMVLSDMGADVLRLERPEPSEGAPSVPATGGMNRGKHSVRVDLKDPAGAEAFLALAESADALVEVFRPGVAERLGIGPETCLARNPRLIYGRLTGWGQEGPYAGLAGHDIDYIALAGALEPIGREGEPPTPPINVLGDFAGGGMLLAFGIACAAFERCSSGRGQVVDAAMIDGAALMMTPFFLGRSSGAWGERGTNFLDTGAPFYNVYETSDHRYVAVGAIEPKFYAELLARLGVEDAGEWLETQWDPSRWHRAKERLSALFSTRTREEWCELLEGTDSCFAPVLTPTEAPQHEHNSARQTFVVSSGAIQPAPAPRFSRTKAAAPEPDADAGAAAKLERWGLERDIAERLTRSGGIS
jgi:alpha-methylacyl-CoA racemase